jgi:3-(methylthio)propionyl---CoA ligase
MKRKRYTDEQISYALRQAESGTPMEEICRRIRDRSKDIIISGGENISSIEIEKLFFQHPAVSSAAVVAQPDEKWGESLCAFVELVPGSDATESDILAHCRDRLAGFKRPKRLVIGELPKTSTGKIRKNELRDRARRESQGTSG